MEKNGYELVSEKTAMRLNVGSRIVDFRGDVDILIGGEPPLHSASTGHVYVDGGSYFPSVFGLKWVALDGDL